MFTSCSERAKALQGPFIRSFIGEKHFAVSVREFNFSHVFLRRSLAVVPVTGQPRTRRAPSGPSLSFS